MRTFLNVIATEPEVARLPIMVDSSKWTILEAGLQCLQGKGIVNSISLKEGEEEFLREARRIRDYGAGVIVMAFDEEGQAADVARRVEICGRAYDLLVGEVGFAPEDIVFDPNVLAVATGIPEHDDYARAFIESLPLIKARCPGTHTSGGISNLSFAFRGNDRIREAMHAAFLYHAVRAGLDMGIVNAGQLAVYEDLEPGAARARRGRDPEPARRRDRAPRRARRTGEGGGDAAGARPHLAGAARRQAPRARARARDRRLRRSRRRGGARGRRTAARRDRRTADGRHARRRGSLRIRPHVPASGREVGAGDEARRRLPPAVHGGRARRRAQRAGQGAAGDRQGRRPRHRQEHRRRGAGVQRLRGDRPRRDGPRRHDPRDRRARARRRRRALRPDHAVARPDGERGARARAVATRAAVADRRRDDLATAHGREDRPGVRVGDRPRARREPGRRRRVEPARPGAARGARRGQPGAAGTPASPARGEGEAAVAAAGSRRARTAHACCSTIFRLRRSPVLERSSRRSPSWSTTSTGSSSSMPGT